MKPTPFTHKLGIRYPIIQAPMSGGSTTPELVAAVANAGALGSFAGGYLAPEAIRDGIRHIRQLTANPFLVNLFIQTQHDATSQQIQTACQDIQSCCAELNITIEPVRKPFVPSLDEQLQVVVDEQVPVFSFAFGTLSEKWMALLRQNNILIIGTATSLQEAKELEHAGVDFIVVQGLEAGGHRGTFFNKDENEHVTLNTLLKQTSSLKTPIIAAGGIMDGNGIKAVFNNGAVAAQLGTAFLTCHESGSSKEYKNALLTQQQDNTILTKAFSGKWARGIENTFIRRMKNANTILPYPIQHALTVPMRKHARELGNIEFMSLFAGQRAHLCADISAKELISKLVRDLNF